MHSDDVKVPRGRRSWLLARAGKRSLGSAIPRLRFIESLRDKAIPAIPLLDEIARSATFLWSVVYIALIVASAAFTEYLPLCFLLFSTRNRQESAQDPRSFISLPATPQSIYCQCQCTPSRLFSLTNKLNCNNDRRIPVRLMAHLPAGHPHPCDRHAGKSSSLQTSKPS